jgi:hypothetical protein
MLDQAIRFGAMLARMYPVLTDPPRPPLRRGVTPNLQANPPLSRGVGGIFSGQGAILEVGSGTRGITAFTDQPVIGVDVAFPGGPVVGLTAIKASATALPIKDACCDRVVCSDMLEHLPDDMRKLAIGELLRVTRGTLLLACPCGSPARSVDGFLGRLYHLLHIPIPDWLSEHLALTLPEPEAIRLTLLAQKAHVKELPGESVATHFLVALLISTKAANRLWTSIFQGRPDRARRVGNWGPIKWGPAYRRLWVVKKPQMNTDTHR